MRRAATAALLLFFLGIQLAGAEELRLGTTYSPQQSEYLDLDWEKTYLSILDMGFDRIRLGSYWNRIETSPGVFDFSTLDWQVAEAKKRGVSVVLTVGMKAPRWPEYYIPQWVLDKAKPRFGMEVSRKKYIQERTLKFIRATVERYRGEDIVRWWQVENEPLDRSGAKYWWIGSKFLKREIELVRELDPKKRPIVVNAMMYPNRFLRKMSRAFARNRPIPEAIALGDILGIDIYPSIGHRFWNRKMYFWTNERERAEYFGGIKRQSEAAGKPVWIMELQAEPWEPGLLVHMSEERPPTGWPEQGKYNIEEFRKMGFETIFLWGAEYWHFRNLKHGDKSWRQMALDFIRSRREAIRKFNRSLEAS